MYITSLDGRHITSALVVDDINSETLNTVYAELRNRTGKNKGANVLGLMGDLVNEIMPGTKEAVSEAEQIVNLSNGQPTGLDEFVNRKAGVCEHMALLSGYLTERLIKDGILRGRVSVDRNFNTEINRGHVWMRYTNSIGEVIIFDTAKNKFMYLADTVDEIKNGGWDYRRPNEKDLKRKWIWGDRTPKVM